MSQQDNVWTTLKRADLVVGDKPEKLTADTPWYIKTLLAVAGWLASLFILAFLGLMYNQLLESVAADIILGSGMIFLAYQLLLKQHSDFVEHLGLAISLAGQALFIFGIIEWQSTTYLASWLAVLCLNVGLVILMPHFVHRVISAFFVCICLAGVMTEFGFYFLALPTVMLICAWCWLHEFDSVRWHRHLTAIGYGSILALLLIQTTQIFDSGMTFLMNQRVLEQYIYFSWSSLLAVAVILYVTVALIKQHQTLTKASSFYILLLAMIFAGAAFNIAGLYIAVMIMVLGFASGHRLLIGLGIIFLLFCISHYYYALNTTLLMKSISLFVLGIVLIGLYWCLPRLFGGKHEAG
ncbi:DUF4401 domain-containing protein [Methylophaga sulfidovorans]|uniref:DUF4401 domain-containing protein n=1 Tax=Methylophaga sulfidovorans TaxID=45496 RepID=A0A1I3Z792_9GAMM|nr:DUF4401 domain-containing protein [Methylophaga sulfidovorans]SFK39903.1 protein of unknown function [Methylophaga sulfidovorans]